MLSTTTLLLGDCCISPAEEAKDVKAVSVEAHESFGVLIKWSDALVATKPDDVLALYSESAVLWPTLSDEIRCSKDAMKPYFEMFAQKVLGDVVWKGAAVQELSSTSV